MMDSGSTDDVYISFKGKQLYILLRLIGFTIASPLRGNNIIWNCKGSNYELILALNIYDIEFYKNALNRFFLLPENYQVFVIIYSGCIAVMFCWYFSY